MQRWAIDLPKRLRYFFPSNWPSLRSRMTISYVSVTLGSVLTFMLLSALVSGVFSSVYSDSLDSGFLAAMQQQAQSYAQVAAIQAQGVALDPQASFIPSQAHTLALPDEQNQVYHVSAPYISAASPDPTSVSLALLIAPDSRLAASSYPSRYPTGMPVSALSPAQARAIDQALAGRASTGTEYPSSVGLGYAAEPVWGKNHRPIGAIFLQAPNPQHDSILMKLRDALLGNIVLLVLVTPAGVFFGWITTRDLVRRARQLVLATTQFASGDYTQRVTLTHQDEIGQLEWQFNTMAEQLVDTMSRRQQLAEQNARLEERARISRELHDAVSQDLFSLRMLTDGLQEAIRVGSTAANLRPQITLLEQTTGSMTREMRALLLELRPTQLEHLSLDEALRELAHTYSTRLGITVTADVQPVALNVKADHALLRITQEALANAARHSTSTLISLSLAGKGDMATLMITDNGEGFAAPNEVDGHGLGLRIMRERVEELHGTFELTTAPGQGTCISVDLPLEHAND